MNGSCREFNEKFENNQSSVDLNLKKRKRRKKKKKKSLSVCIEREEVHICSVMSLSRGPSSGVAREKNLQLRREVRRRKRNDVIERLVDMASEVGMVVRFMNAKLSGTPPCPS